MATDRMTNNIDQEDNNISLKELFLITGDWFRYLLTKWVIIVFIGVSGGIAGFVYAYLKDIKFTATTSFVLEDAKEGGLGPLAGIASVAGIDLGSGGGGIFQGDNIFELYKSRRMIEKTLFTETDFNGKNILLINYYIDFNELREAWDSKPKLKGIKFIGQENLTRVQDSLVGLIVGDIRTNYLNVAKLDKKLSIINASVTSTDEFFAKNFDEAIVKNVNEFYIETKTKKSKENVKILTTKADSIKRVMNGDIYAAVAITDATPNINPTRQVKRIAPAQKAQFSAEANKSILALLTQNLEMAKTSLMKETPLIQIVDEPIYPLDKSKLSKVKGGFVGGLIAGFLIVIVLTVRRAYKKILS